MPNSNSIESRKTILDRSLIFPCLLFVAIVALGIGSRLWFENYPNFKPVAALALFAGFYFRQFRVAVAVVLLTLLVSDLFIGSYEWQIAFAVYGSILIAGGLGWLIGRQNHQALGVRSIAKRTASFMGASIVMSTVFYLLTNLATWWCWYEISWQGLQDCYVAAIPFYSWTLTGDFLFSVSVVTLYHACLLALATSKVSTGVAAPN